MTDKDLLDHLEAAYSTQLEAAKAIGVSLRTYQYWREHGRMPKCWKNYLELKLVLEKLK